MDQNRRPRSIGIAGQIPSDQVAKFIGIGTKLILGEQIFTEANRFQNIQKLPIMAIKMPLYHFLLDMCLRCDIVAICLTVKKKR
jgi:hypothetical protein